MSKDCFNSIEDLPIWNWWKIAETGNLSYLYKDEKEYKENDNSLVELWTKIQDEYLEEFGITDNFKELLTLKKKWINQKSDFLITGDRFILNSIDEIESDLREIEKTSVTVDKDDTTIMLEEKLGRELDAKTMSVKRYYKYINYYSKKK